MAGSVSREFPSPIEIQTQLDRIIASPAFRASKRNRSFLHYVVNEAIAGRGAKLKAYCIATDVFARGETFDAQNDPVVRIEAARLRAALERYYLLAGTTDAILIDIPKGGYCPTFTLRKRTQEANGHYPPSETDDTAGWRWSPLDRHHLFVPTMAAIGMLLVATVLLAVNSTMTKSNTQTLPLTHAHTDASCRSETQDCGSNGR